jgi:4-methyl-5(b-hydroxyethyl)-thiazole monophosphate biosynthesis
LFRYQIRTFTASTKSLHPKVVVAVANGSEELETVTIIDTLRRANIEVNVSKVGEDESLECIMSRGVKLVTSFNQH